MTQPRVLTRGPAGCGKTREALLQCKAFLGDHGYALRDDQRILMLSCTTAAVSRIHQTMPALLAPEQRTRIALDTFAAFKWDLLCRFGRYLGVGRNPQLVSPVSRLDGLPPKRGEVVFADFDEQVLRLLRASRSLAAAYRDRFPIVVIDELQDTSDADWELVRILAESALLRCFGDPNQAVGMTTLEAARTRMQAAIGFGCAVRDMSGGSHRDRSAGRVVTALAEAIRDGGDIGVAGQAAKVEKALWVRRYAFPNTLSLEVKYVLQHARARHPDWQIGVLTLMKANVDTLSRGLLTRTDAAPFVVSHRVVGRQDVCLATDPFLLAAWSRACGQAVTDADLIRQCGLAVASVLSQTSLEGVAKQLVVSASSATTHKGKARQVLEALASSANRPDPDQFDRVADAVAVLGSTRFEAFALTRIEVLRRRAERLLAQRDCNMDELIADGREASAEEAGIRKTAQPARVQLMTIDSCKGREFDLVLLVNHPHEPFLRPADAPGYSAARAKLYTAITRAKYAVAVLLPKDDACELLGPLA